MQKKGGKRATAQQINGQRDALSIAPFFLSLALSARWENVRQPRWVQRWITAFVSAAGLGTREIKGKEAERRRRRKEKAELL